MNQTKEYLAARGLMHILQGVALIVLDPNIDIAEHKVDLIPDFVGWLLISLGCLKLTFEIPATRYQKYMQFATYVTVGASVDSLVELGDTIENTMFVATHLSCSVFAVAMHLLCKNSLPKLANSWKVVAIFVTFGWVLPGSYFVIQVLQTGEPVYFEGLAAVPFYMPLFVMLGLIWVTSRAMRRSGAISQPGGLMAEALP
jgi:hypothetical protein